MEFRVGSAPAQSVGFSRVNTTVFDAGFGVGVGTCSFWSCPERQCISCVCVALRFGN